MRVRGLISTVLVLSFCSSSWGADIVSSTSSDKKVHVTELADKRLRFEVCSNAAESTHCRTIGDEDGYSRVEVVKRIQKMDQEATFDSRVNLGIGVGGVALGLLVGFTRPVSHGSFMDLSIIEQIMNAGKYGLLLGGTGVGVVVLKKNLMDGPASGAESSLGVAANLAADDKVFVINDSMDNFIKYLNYALM